MSVQHSMLRMGGGLPLGENFRSLERSLNSECSPTTSYGTHEGGDDLDGVTQVGVERQQQMYVRYSGMSEGTQLIAAREEAVTKSRYLSWKNLSSDRAVAEHIQYVSMEHSVLSCTSLPQSALSGYSQETSKVSVAHLYLHLEHMAVRSE